MSLSPRWRMGRFCGPRRSDPFGLCCIEDVQLIGAALPIISTEEEDFVPNQIGSVATQSWWRCSQNFRL